MATLTYTQTFTIICCDARGCGVSYGLSNDFIEARQKDRGTFYCPNGHSRWYPGETAEQKAKRLEQELKAVRSRSNARVQQLRDQLGASERSKRAYKGQATKLRSKVERVEAGVCPHCNRSFRDLRAHMESKHLPHSESS